MSRPHIVLAFLLLFSAIALGTGPIEAPTGFDDLDPTKSGLGNGLTSDADFLGDGAQFSEVEGQDKGLGPLFNGTSCVECHRNPVAGGLSQVTELRVGHLDHRGHFVAPADGSLVNDLATNADIQARVPPTETVRTLRTSLNTLGDGFVEAIADATIEAIAAAQPGQTHGRVHGHVIRVPIVEAPAAPPEVARFGWKNQHRSLVSFSGDAYVNEMGITTPFFPTERTSNGRSTDPFNQDLIPGVPNNPGADVRTFARFIRATKAPARDAKLSLTAEAGAGEALFHRIGCAVCHVDTIVTAPAGTAINGGDFTIPSQLGDKIIHPFGDFLLHDVGTGDGIVQNGGQDTAQTMRTAPLWGVRSRTRLMHDGASLTFENAIRRHDEEAREAREAFFRLRYAERSFVITFLTSL